MSQYIDKLIYGSTQNGNSRSYELKDTLSRNMIFAIQNQNEEEANLFYEQSKKGFGSTYNINNNFDSAAAAINAALPRWHICTN